MATHQPRKLTPAEEMRLFRGLAVQPFLAACVAFVSFQFLMLDSDGRSVRGGYVDDPTGAAIGVAIYAFVAAFLVTAFVVLPAAVWLLKRQFVTFTQCLVIGLGLGNLPMALGTMLGGGNVSLIRSHAFASLIGVAGAAVFWIISIRGRDFSRNPSPSLETSV